MAIASTSTRFVCVVVLLCASGTVGARFKRRERKWGGLSLPSIPSNVNPSDVTKMIPGVPSNVNPSHVTNMIPGVPSNVNPSDVTDMIPDVGEHIPDVGTVIPDVRPFIPDVDTLVPEIPTSHCAVPTLQAIKLSTEQALTSYAQCLGEHCENVHASVLIGAFDLKDMIPDVSAGAHGFNPIEMLKSLVGTAFGIGMKAITSNVEDVTDMLADMVPNGDIIRGIEMPDAEMPSMLMEGPDVTGGGHPSIGVPSDMPQFSAPSICDSVVFAHAPCSQTIGETLANFGSLMLDAFVDKVSGADPKFSNRTVSEVIGHLVQNFVPSSALEHMAVVGITPDKIANCDFSGFSVPSGVGGQDMDIDIRIPSGISSPSVAENVSVDALDIVLDDIPQNLPADMLGGIGSDESMELLKDLGDICMSMRDLKMDDFLNFDLLGLLNLAVPEDVKFILDAQVAMICPGKPGCCGSTGGKDVDSPASSGSGHGHDASHGTERGSGSGSNVGSGLSSGSGSGSGQGSAPGTAHGSGHGSSHGPAHGSGHGAGSGSAAAARPKQHGDFRKTPKVGRQRVRRAIRFAGDFDKVVGAQKAQFLSECTAKLAHSGVECSDVRKGSIIVDYTGAAADVEEDLAAIEAAGTLELDSFDTGAALEEVEPVIPDSSDIVVGDISEIADAVVVATATPTAAPTAEATIAPTAQPTTAPTTLATPRPTPVPTATPTATPTEAPTLPATTQPTPEPTSEATPEAAPEATPEPTPEVTPEVTEVIPEITPEPTPEGTEALKSSCQSLQLGASLGVVMLVLTGASVGL